MKGLLGQLLPDVGNDEFEQRRMWLLFALIFLTTATLLIFSGYNFLVGNQVTGFFTLVVGLVSAVALVCFRHSSRRGTINRVTIGLLTILFLWLVVNGVHNGSTILWMYTLPPILIFFLGEKEGLVWLLTVYLSLIAVFYGNLPEVSQYESSFKIRFLVSFGLVSTVYYWIESFRRKSHKELVCERHNLKSERKNLRKALDEIKVLKGILPICSHCKQIRDTEGNWNRMEKYVSERSEAEFTHGVCPECLEKHYFDSV